MKSTCIALLVPVSHPQPIHLPPPVTHPPFHPPAAGSVCTRSPSRPSPHQCCARSTPTRTTRSPPTGPEPQQPWGRISQGVRPRYNEFRVRCEQSRGALTAMAIASSNTPPGSLRRSKTGKNQNMARFFIPFFPPLLYCCSWPSTPHMRE